MRLCQHLPRQSARDGRAAAQARARGRGGDRSLGQRPVRALLLTIALAAPCWAAEPFEPYEGQPGKDVVWVPTPRALVDKMLDLAGVTARDFVVDLGSGDGRLVIAAAKRGARALGIEYDADMVALSERNAAAAGVADKASFVQGDVFEADFSQAKIGRASWR